MRGFDVKTLRQIASGNEDVKKSGAMTGLLTREIHLFGSLISDKQKEGFYLEMNLLLSAGIDLRSAFDLILAEKRKQKVQQVFSAIKDQVINGTSLSESLMANGHFSEYEYVSIQIGEETGRLPEILEELSGYYAKKIKQRRQMIKALTYPAIVVSFALVAVIFMLNFVVPMFADVFKRFGSELPALTKFIIKLSASFSSVALYFGLFFIGMIAIFFVNRKQPWFRNFTTKLIINTPVVGKLIHKIYLARFCNAMHLMISAKTPLLRAVKLANNMIGFYPIERALVKIENDIINGRSLHESLNPFTIFPHKMVALVKAGEEVNRLDFFFKRLYQQYSDEIEYQSEVLGSLLEPFIIIFLGLLVGIILVAMYLPLFQLGQNF